jgi:hypothetical protein
MGELMHILRDDQRRLEECAETIPVLLVMEFEAPPARSTRELRLMATNGEQAQMLQEHRDMIEALQSRNSVLARQVAELKSQLATLRGDNATPQRGCKHHQTWIDDAPLLVEYEYRPPCAPIYDADHPGVGPGHDAEVSLVNVLVNGHWIDPEAFMAPATQDRITQSIIDAESEA